MAPRRIHCRTAPVGPVTPDLASFERNYSCPEWFRNAKFGIYMHWGLNSLPGMSGHYARNMYHQAEPEISRLGSGYNDNQMKFTAQDVRFTVAKDGSVLFSK